MTFNRKDRFFHKAKSEGFAARSAYKLEEMQKKYRLLRSGDWVLDLGAAPGAWSQIAARFIGQSGKIWGIDLKEITIQVPNAQFKVMDAFEFNLSDCGISDLNVVLSDMAPNTTGIRNVDQARSHALCDQALNLALKLLRPGGHFVVKIFEGPDAEKFSKELRSFFGQVKRFKPEAVRKGSFETYLIGLGKS